MKKFVVVDVLLRFREVEAETDDDALSIMPEPVEGMTLSNWHVAAEASNDEHTGALNYRQVK
jgi:hypothetical protein